MTQTDFPGIIREAAQSSLGILSLLILVVALLAWRFFSESGDRVKLAVFALMFLALVGFALSIIMQSGGQPTKVSRTGADQPSGVAAAPDQQQSAKAADPPSAMAASGSAVRDIAGKWRDSYGTEKYDYDFVQRGASFTYTSYLNGERASRGEGTIRGDSLTYRYHNERTSDDGICSGRFSPSGTTVDGKCGNGEAEWGFSIER